MKIRCFVFVSLVVLSGCASYNAAALNTPSSEVVQISSKNEDISILAKAFNKADCRRYLDRDVIREGYQPVQLYIQNNSDKSYYFSLDSLNFSYAHPEEVADKVHTSTVGRAVGYGVGALFLWPLAIPAIVDGIKSSEANKALDVDFSAKAARDQVILPHSHFNRIVFVPLYEYQPAFNMTLIDQTNNSAKSFDVVVR